MCRWLAYAGRPIAIEALLFKPCNSLINQSLCARRATTVTQGDGFGLGWYGQRPRPGLYRDVMPAWNDFNLRSLSEQIESRLFFAHVRASTGTATARVNCHPFRYDRWLFMHNGQIGGWFAVRRTLEQLVGAEYYVHREGGTDSEVIFYLLLTNGLDRDPVGALARTVAQVLAVMAAHGVAEPLRLTAALTDGESIYAVRFSSDRASPSLFYGTGGGLRIDDGSCHFSGGEGMVLVLSEPLDAFDSRWCEVPEGQVLTARAGSVVLEPFGVAALVG